jgi:hypothetical protein
VREIDEEAFYPHGVAGAFALGVLTESLASGSAEKRPGSSPCVVSLEEPPRRVDEIECHREVEETYSEQVARLHAEPAGGKPMSRPTPSWFDVLVEWLGVTPEEKSAHDAALRAAGYDPKAMTAREIVEAHGRGLLPAVAPDLVATIDGDRVTFSPPPAGRTRLGAPYLDVRRSRPRRAGRDEVACSQCGQSIEGHLRPELSPEQRAYHKVVGCIRCCRGGPVVLRK